MTYTELKGMIGGREYIVIARNTVAQRMSNGNILVMLHGNTIGILSPDSRVKVNSCGFYTKTTRNRINSVLPHHWQVVQRNGIWLLEFLANGHTELFPFMDNMEIDLLGNHVLYRGVRLPSLIDSRRY